jgi:uncharacterized lipoprotein YajG
MTEGGQTMKSKRMMRVIAAGIGAGFVLTACAVSSRQIVTGPTVQLLSVSPAQEVVLPAATEDRTTLPALADDAAQAPAKQPIPAKDATKAQDASKTVEQAKTTEKAVDAYKDYGSCAGYGD